MSNKQRRMNRIKPTRAKGRQPWHLPIVAASAVPRSIRWRLKFLAQWLVCWAHNFPQLRRDRSTIGGLALNFAQLCSTIGRLRVAYGLGGEVVWEHQVPWISAVIFRKEGNWMNLQTAGRSVNSLQTNVRQQYLCVFVIQKNSDRWSHCELSTAGRWYDRVT